jgi:signal transduction histidine kinase
LPRGLGREIDTELGAVVVKMVEEGRGRDNRVVLADIDWPEGSNSLQLAASFYVVLSPEGEIVTGSHNWTRALPLYSGYDENTARVHNVAFEDHILRVINYPIIGRFEEGDRRLGTVQVGRLINDLDEINRLTTATVFIGAATLSLSVFILAFILPIILKPLNDIVSVAGQITSADDLSVRIESPPQPGELGSLVEVFNQLMERLETLFKTQQRLLGDVSHELRTPLTAMRGNIDLIRRVGADPDLLDSTETEMDRLTRLVTDLLSLARAEVGGLPIRQEELDLDIIFLNTYEQMVRLDGSVKLVLRGVERARVLGDPDRLKQLIINLITNGLKYTDPGGSVWISLICEGEEVVVTVEDSGIGIPAEDLPNIFTRFYRVNKARTRQRGGAGLGLAIVKTIVDAHDGTIHVESVVNKGTKFVVRLPLLESAEYTFYDDFPLEM